MADPTVAHADAADATFSATGATNWNKNHVLTGLLNADSPTFAGLTLTGLTSGRVAIVGTGGVLEDDAGLLYNKTTDVLSVGGTVVGVSGAASSASAVALGIRGVNTGFYDDSGAGQVKIASGGSQIGTLYGSAWLNYTNNFGGINQNAFLATTAANEFIFSAAASATPRGSATSRAEINKSVTAIPDNTATAVVTFTIPNAPHSGEFLVRISGSAGATNASVGACESTQAAYYICNLTRTAGVNAVGALSAILPQPAAATVAGGNAVATTAVLSAVGGAVGATNTFTINATIARAGGSATDHVALVEVSLMNKNASGITVA